MKLQLLASQASGEPGAESGVPLQAVVMSRRSPRVLKLCLSPRHTTSVPAGVRAVCAGMAHQVSAAMAHPAPKPRHERTKTKHSQTRQSCPGWRSWSRKCWPWSPLQYTTGVLCSAIHEPSMSQPTWKASSGVLGAGLVLGAASDKTESRPSAGFAKQASLPRRRGTRRGQRTARCVSRAHLSAGFRVV